MFTPFPKLVLPSSNANEPPYMNVFINCAWIPVLMALLQRLEYRSTWVDGTDTVRAEAQALTLARMFVNAPCDMPPDRCFEFTPNATFIEYIPQNPYTQPDLVPDGYLFPPFYLATSLSNVALGTHLGDVVTDLSRIPFVNPIILPSSGLPQIRIHIEGKGTVELHFGNINLGGLIQITHDDNPLTVQFLELGKDVISIPPETADNIIIERKFETEGTHVIDLIFVPTWNDTLNLIQFGGSLRKIELCGFESTVDMAIPVFGLTLVDGILSLTADDVPVSNLNLMEFVDLNVALTELSWRIEDCSLRYNYRKPNTLITDPLEDWYIVDNWFGLNHPNFVDCVPIVVPIPPLAGDRCNIAYWAANYIISTLDGYAARILDGVGEMKSPVEIIQDIFTFFEAEGISAGAWWYLNFVFIRNKINTLDDLIELGLMRDMFTDEPFLYDFQKSVYCGTPNDGELVDGWLANVASQALFFLTPAYGSAAAKFAELIEGVLSLSDLRPRALLWAMNSDHTLDCTEFDCATTSPPITLYVCDGYEGSLETITNALEDGTTGHYKAILGWYDTSVPDTAQHVCIAMTGVGEEADGCFIIENITVTLGVTPDGYKGEGIGTGFTDCDYVDHNSPDIGDTENVAAVRVRWSHSAESAIEIEFDLRRDV